MAAHLLCELSRYLGCRTWETQKVQIKLIKKTFLFYFYFFYCVLSHFGHFKFPDLVFALPQTANLTFSYPPSILYQTAYKLSNFEENEHVICGCCSCLPRIKPICHFQISLLGNPTFLFLCLVTS